MIFHHPFNHVTVTVYPEGNYLLQQRANLKDTKVSHPFEEPGAILAFNGVMFKWGKITCSLTLGLHQAHPWKAD